MARKTVDRATFNELFKIKERLDQVVVKRETAEGEPKLCYYSGSFDDQTIASELGVSKTSVANVRVSQFGKLFIKGEGESDNLKAKISALEVMVEALTTAHLDLTDRFNRLCDNITANQILSVKHLKSPQKQPPSLPLSH